MRMSVYKFVEDEKKYFCVTDKLNVMPFRFCRLALSGDKTAAVLRRWRGTFLPRREAGGAAVFLMWREFFPLAAIAARFGMI